MARLTGYSSVRVSRAKRAYVDLSSLFLVLMRVHGLRYVPKSTKREELQNDYLPLRDSINLRAFITTRDKVTVHHQI